MTTTTPDATPRAGSATVVRLPAPGVDALLAALLAAFVVGLLRHGQHYEPLVDGWLGSLSTVLPALVVVLRGWTLRGPGRRAVLLLGSGAVCWSLGGVFTVVMAGRDVTLPFPSWGDLGFLCFPVLGFAGLAVRLRRDLAGVRRSVWLDSALGALGATTALALLLGPLVSGATGGPLAMAVAAAYPLGDLVLVALVVAVIVSSDLRPDSSWLWLLAGLLVFAAADVVYALRWAHGSYVLGTPLDAGWSLGLTLLAVGARPVRPGRVPEQRSGRAALAVPGLATAVALCVLVLGRWTHVPALATGLAAMTVLAAGVRTQLAFRQVVRLYDLGTQARTDSLTQLGNRRALYDHLSGRLVDGAPQRLAFLLVDLDHFKEINDTLGHHVGDELLRQIGPRMSGVLAADDLLVRLGGDEFAVVVPASGGRSPEAVAELLLSSLAEPFHLDDVPLRVGASIGIAVCPEDATDTNGLLQRADVAMYSAKSHGGGVRRYDPERDAYSRERLRTLEELRVAIDSGQLVLHYQPQCDVRAGAVLGLEALVRWQHPSRGLVPPDQFLPLVEQTGLMPALTTHVLRQSVEQCRRWRSAGLAVSVSVNVSASSLLDVGLPDLVARLLREHDLPPDALTLELTENTLMADPQQCRATLGRLADLGVVLSIDDYGTGYCSLSYLQDLPVDELKLDRAFMSQLGSSRNAAIVRSTVDLAHALGLRLVAEGVEDEETLSMLRQLGCDVAQGYHLGRPLPADEATAWLSGRARQASSPAVVLS
jgi:diguanylate cyclase (GGDEF)-like protein